MSTYYKNSEIINLNINDVVPNFDQPRSMFNEKPLTELSESIRTHGVLEPILVVRSGICYKIIAGERRYRASRLAGLTRIPAIIIDGSKEQLREIAIVENLHRQQLNPIEEAEAVRILMEAHSLTQEQTALALGRSRSAIANLLRLLTLPMDVQVLLREGKLSQGHARVLMSVKNQATLVVMATKCVEEKWSVHALTEELKRLSRVKSGKAAARAPRKVSAELKFMVEDIERVFQTPVAHSGDDRKGKLVIEYKSTQELNRIYDVIQRLKNTDI